MTSLTHRLLPRWTVAPIARRIGGEANRMRCGSTDARFYPYDGRDADKRLKRAAGTANYLVIEQIETPDCSGSLHSVAALSIPLACRRSTRPSCFAVDSLLDCCSRYQWLAITQKPARFMRSMSRVLTLKQGAQAAETPPFQLSRAPWLDSRSPYHLQRRPRGVAGTRPRGT